MSRAAFSCDACGAPVDLHAVRCPRCGKAFEAVRCPRCGHQGRPGAFANGCPRCRYLADDSDRAARSRRSLFVPVMAVLLGFLVVASVVVWALRGG